MEPAGTNWRRVYTLRDFSGVLFRQKGAAIACFILVMAVAIGLLMSAPERYESELRILVKHDRSDSLITGSAGSERALPAEVSEQEVNSEIELLQSADLLAEVAKTTGLVDRQQEAGWQRFIRGSSTDESRKQASQEEALSRAVRELRGDLQVAPVRRTWMISVKYTSTDPQLSKQVLDTLSRLYLEKHLAVRRTPGARQFFVEQAEQSAKELEAIQVQLRTFGEKNGTVSASTEREAVLAKVAEFESMGRQTEAALAEAGARLTALQLERARTPTRSTASITTGDATGFTQEMQSKIATLEMRKTELLQKYTPQYRLVVELEQQIGQARSALEDARKSQLRQETTEENPTMRWLDNEIARVRTEHSALAAKDRALKSVLGRYRAQAQTLDVANFEQSELLRELKAAEDKYVLYQRKQEEARISDALDETRISNAAIVQAASVPFEPQPRRSMMWMGIAFCVALFVAIAVAWLKDLAAAAVRIRTPDELQAALGDVPVLAWVPAARR